MQQKSVFVTVVAWIFIVLSGFGVLILAADAALFWTLPFDKLMAQSAALHPSQPQLPAAFVTTLIRWVFVVLLLLEAWMLASSIGLLLRKNWARISFIVILAIGMVWAGRYLLFGILAMVGIHFAGHMAVPPAAPPGFQSFMAYFVQAFMIIFVILDIGVLVLYGWMVKKLTSGDIRKEFEKPADKSGALAA